MADLNNFKKALEEKGLIPAIKQLFQQHVTDAPSPNPEPTPAPEPEKLATNMVDLKNGSKVTYEGEKLDIGVAVKMVNADGTNSEMPDGEYELADGSKLTVKGGLVESIVPVASTEPPPMEMPEMMAKVASMETQLAEQKKELSAYKEKFEAMEKTVNGHKEAVKTTLEAIHVLAETPAENHIVKVKSYEEMSAVERFRASKK